MRCSVLWVLIIYFYSDNAVQYDDFNDLPVPDFTDYEDVPEKNFSMLFMNKEEKNVNDKVPLTSNEQNLEKLQETTTTCDSVRELNEGFQIVSVTKNTLIIPKQKDKKEMFTEIIEIHEKTNNFISTTTFHSEASINNFVVVADDQNNAEYQNNNLQPIVTDNDLEYTSLKRKLTKEAARVHDKELWKRAPSRPSATNKKLDIPALVAMLKDVAMDYENSFNLAKKFVTSLEKFNIPTCKPLPSTTPPTTINFDDARLVAKCFVCGLREEGIPYSTGCADAFAGEFMPVMKVNTKSRGKIASYRKYCRYLNVPNFLESAEEPQSLFGRFTGGCSVRWVDITGAYSQRTCRNRRRPITGKHLGSKRMAKLEMTLSNLDNGCIISPVASLVPVSRGISLFARFHVCVCSGSWCNVAERPQNSITAYLLLFLISIINR